MKCQSCANEDLTHILSLGYLPPVNDFRVIGEEAKAQYWMPTDLMYCSRCELVQLAYTGDKNIIFPPSYPYTSGTTKILRDNFADLAREARRLIDLGPDDLVVDIGSNDGTLLSNFKGRTRICGIEPTDIADVANERGIYTIKTFFDGKASMDHQAKLVTCCNCFAHMDGIRNVIEGVKHMLTPDGVFVTESHYLISLLNKLQYDTIYHEHLRYYSLTSLRNLLAQHGLHIFFAKKIPTHGGSIRAYATLLPIEANLIGAHSLLGGAQSDAIDKNLFNEPTGDEMLAKLKCFANDVVMSKLNLVAEITYLKATGKTVCGISAPSRAATVVNYCRLDASLIDYICEVEGSLKIGKYMPGTDIPVVEESVLFADPQPDFAILFSWHIADELMPKLRSKGYRGHFILPCARVDQASVIAA